MGMVSGTEIVCPACGWHNEPSARMCGGCGTVLPALAARMGTPGATVALPSPPIAPGSAGDNATTVYVPQAPPAPIYGQPPPYVPPASGPAAWTPPTPQTARAGGAVHGRTVAGRGWRRLLVAVLVLAVLACAGLGAWNAAVRPALHTQVDGALAAALDSAADQMASRLSALPPGVGGTVEIPAGLVNDLIQQRLPADVPVRDVVLQFTNGGVRVHYSLLGRDGTLVTQLASVGGRLVAHDTAVYGPLRSIETGPELQRTLAGALARLPHNVAISKVRVSGDSLFLTARTTG